MTDALGEIAFEQCKYSEARAYHAIAIRAAHEAECAPLEAVARARQSFAWGYDGQWSQASQSILRARAQASHLPQPLPAWLALVEAEIAACLNQQARCFQALREAEAGSQLSNQEDPYWIGFDASLALSYRGVCLSRLARHGHASLLAQAQRSLQEALGHLSPVLEDHSPRAPLSMPHNHSEMELARERRARYLIDLADISLQAGELEAMTAYALAALEHLSQTNSPVTVKRLIQLRAHCHHWETASSVHQLDQVLAARGITLLEHR